MDRERVLQDQTVVVANGRITALGPSASTPVPAGATRVDARGKFLIPGIAEIHAHIPPATGPLGPQWAEDVLFLYVAAGATSIRGMQGHATQLELRRRVDTGELIGPRMWLAAPQLNNNSAPDAATAERLTREYKAAGFDLLKIQEGLRPEAYAAVVRTAREIGIPWGGHVPDDVGVHVAIREKQSTIDHLDNYIIGAQRDGAPFSPQNIDDAKIPELARATRDAGVAVVPTMSLWETLRGGHDAQELLTRDELRYVPRAMVQQWTNSVNNTRANVQAANAQAEIAFRNRMLKALSDAGVRILMGTDAPQIFSVPGFSLFRELPVMVAAGLTPFQVLQSGTVNVARHFGVENDAGTVAVGKRADLILLDANPLENIANVERRAGVMVNGRWLSRAEIDRRLDEMAARRASS
jgi:imidazolonepropionase-like amidohydrolase